MLTQVPGLPPPLKNAQPVENPPQQSQALKQTSPIWLQQRRVPPQLSASPPQTRPSQQAGSCPGTQDWNAAMQIGGGVEHVPF
jgi:hypothetical protein